MNTPQTSALHWQSSGIRHQASVPKRGPRTDNRRFLNALLWMARSGERWHDLPERLGDYRSVKRRYYRWIEMGVLDDMLAVLARETCEFPVCVCPERNHRELQFKSNESVERTMSDV